MSKKRDKVKLGFYVSAETADKFRQFVMKKHDSFERGLLSAEGEVALISWMAQHKGTHIEAPNPAPKVALVWKEVKEYMEDFYGVDCSTGTTMMLRHIKQGIRGVRGGDNRTIKRWLKDFHTSGLIKPLGGPQWEVM